MSAGRKQLKRLHIRQTDWQRMMDGTGKSRREGKVQQRLDSGGYRKPGSYKK